MANRAAIISNCSVLSQSCNTSVLHGVSVYHPAHAGTKSYSLVTEAHTYEWLAQSYATEEGHLDYSNFGAGATIRHGFIIIFILAAVRMD